LVIDVSDIDDISDLGGPGVRSIGPSRCARGEGAKDTRRQRGTFVLDWLVVDALPDQAQPLGLVIAEIVPQLGP
jgi:hypothetical protein